MRHILVVDDDPDVCDVMKAVLEESGIYRATDVSNADEAVAVIARDRPDAAIIDAVLPRVSGVQLAGRVLGNGIPVLLVSGQPLVDKKLEEQGLRFLPKPFRVAQLLAETQALLAEAALRQEDLERQLRTLADNTSALMETRLIVRKAVETSRESRLERQRRDRDRKDD
jgi:two-component system, OmpR family, response regulator MprA